MMFNSQNQNFDNSGGNLINNGGNVMINKTPGSSTEYDKSNNKIMKFKNRNKITKIFFHKFSNF